MNVWTCRLRNISVDKSIKSSKCNLSVNNNSGQRSSNRTGTGISRKGKRNTYGNNKMDDDSSSSIKSALDTTDSSRSCDRSSDRGELAPRMKRGKQSNECVVKMVLEIKEEMKTWRENFKKIDAMEEK